jgi:hypothetical protein
MLTALKIIGIIVVVVIIGGILLLRMVMKFVKGAVDAMPTCPPCRVSLEPEAEPQWLKPEVVQKYAAQFREQGFQDVGAFSVPELGGLQLLAFVHPGERLYGAVYEHKKLPHTFDIVCGYPDESGITGTNTKIGETLDPRPGQVTLRLDQADVATVFRAVLDKAGPAERNPVAVGDFVSHFKRAYVRGMNWRMKKGGSSREEIRRQAAAQGNEVTDEQVDAVYESLRSAYVTELRAGCLAQFLDEQQLKASEWEFIQNRVAAIPETLTVKEVIEVIQDYASLDNEQEHQLQQITTSFGETAVDVVQRIVQQNIATLKLKVLGETQEPVRALVVQFPHAEDEAPALENKS